MSRGGSRRKRLATLKGIDTEDIRFTLQQRARSLATAKHHLLGGWYSAKKRAGKGAQHATCRLCASTAFVLPRGEVTDASHQPAIYGDAIFHPCAVVEGRC